jgi:hypothetical protein
MTVRPIRSSRDVIAGSSARLDSRAAESDADVDTSALGPAVKPRGDRGAL